MEDMCWRAWNGNWEGRDATHGQFYQKPSEEDSYFHTGSFLHRNGSQ